MQIWQPYQLKKTTFPNRVVLAPMVTFGFPVAPQHCMSEAQLQHYFARIEGGIGLVISQSVSITPHKMGGGGTGIYSQAQVPYLRQLAAACHAQGSPFFPQLSFPDFNYEDLTAINSYSTAQLDEIAALFVQAATIASLAECDGVELHGAHSYFLNALLSPYTNKRTDRYGGALSGRLEMVRRIVQGIRTQLGEDFLICYRMGWNDSLETDIQTAQALAALGIDMLHISHGLPVARRLELPADFPYDEIVYSGCQIGRQVDIPVITVSEIHTISRGEALLQQGFCDFVAYGRPFLADAAFVQKSQQNPDYRPCLGCKECHWFTNSQKCPAQIKLAKQK